MKSIILIGLLLSLNSTFAAKTICMAGYTVGIGHILSGETSTLYHNDDPTDHDQAFDLNQTVADEYNQVLVVEGEEGLQVTAQSTNGEVLEMTTKEPAPGLTISFSTTEPTLKPSGVPGSFVGAVRLFVMCSQE